MIRSLADAQGWFEAVDQLARMMERIARRYLAAEVADKTLGETLHRDNDLRHREIGEIEDLVRRVRDDLDDLVVLLMFSVFEADVRQRTLDEVDREVESPPRHVVLRKAVAAARETVEHGSFGRLTESYKVLDPDLKSQVDQVRHYRNWVAHGRRGMVRNNVSPQAALARLEQFLALLDTGDLPADADSPVAGAGEAG